MEFIYERGISHVADELLDDDMLQRVEAELIANPRAGVVIQHMGGCRKLRVALPGRGKSGGARAIYLYIEIRSRIHFIALYAKSAQADLSPAEKHYLSGHVRRLKEE